MRTSALIIAFTACLGLAACGGGNETGGSPADSAALVQSDGSILITLRGETVDRDSAGNADSAQCQFQPSVSNQSSLDLKSLIAEFEITQASDGTVIERTATLTMPMAIAAGESKDAWGTLLVDKHRCEDLVIKLLPAPSYHCRTVSKEACPAYRLEASGVARAQ